MYRFGMPGSEPGCIGYRAEGLRFSVDGGALFVAERSNARISAFTIDGYFKDHIGVGIVADGPKDIEITSTGDVVVTDAAAKVIRVLPALDTPAAPKNSRREWGSTGTASSCFGAPTALCIAGVRLFVLDDARSLVNMFE